VKQSRTMSAVESLTNVVVGLGVSVVANMVALPFFGFPVTTRQSVALAVFFTAVSLVRSYTLRRLFEFLRVVR
jgi:hypothetical protein